MNRPGSSPAPPAPNRMDYLPPVPRYLFAGVNFPGLELQLEMIRDETRKTSKIVILHRTIFHVILPLFSTILLDCMQRANANLGTSFPPTPRCMPAIRRTLVRKVDGLISKISRLGTDVLTNPGPMVTKDQHDVLNEALGDLKRLMDGLRTITTEELV